MVYFDPDMVLDAFFGEISYRMQGGQGKCNFSAGGPANTVQSLLSLRPELACRRGFSEVHRDLGLAGGGLHGRGGGSTRQKCRSVVGSGGVYRCRNGRDRTVHDHGEPLTDPHDIRQPVSVPVSRNGMVGGHLVCLVVDGTTPEVRDRCYGVMLHSSALDKVQSRRLFLIQQEMFP